MKIQITNIKLKHIEPITTGSVRRIGGTVLMVHHTVDNVKKSPLNIQIETKNDGSEIFYQPDWQFSNTNLKKLVRQTAEWEKEYEEQQRMEYSEWDKYDPEDPNEDIAIPLWL